MTAQNNYEFALDDWNLFDTMSAWRNMTLGTPEDRMRKMRDPDLRKALRDGYRPGPLGSLTNAIPDLTIGECFSEETRSLEGLTVGEVAEMQGKHVLDVMLDTALADELRTQFITPPQEIDMDAMRELANAPFSLPGISDGGAHMKFMTTGRYPTEFLTHLVRENGIDGPRAGPLAAVGLPGHGRRLHRPRLPARRGAGRPHRLRLRRAQAAPHGAAARLPGRRLAPVAEGRRLPAHRGQR